MTDRLMKPRPLLLSDQALAAFEEGVDCTRVRLARTVDDQYEIEIFGGTLPEDAGGRKPEVPLADREET